jgi:hypothetical protein
MTGSIILSPSDQRANLQEAKVGCTWPMSKLVCPISNIVGVKPETQGGPAYQNSTVSCRRKVGDARQTRLSKVDCILSEEGRRCKADPLIEVRLYLVGGRPEMQGRPAHRNSTSVCRRKVEGVQKADLAWLQIRHRSSCKRPRTLRLYPRRSPAASPAKSSRPGHSTRICTRQRPVRYTPLLSSSSIIRFPR